MRRSGSLGVARGCLGRVRGSLEGVWGGSGGRSRVFGEGPVVDQGSCGANSLTAGRRIGIPGAAGGGRGSYIPAKLSSTNRMIAARPARPSGVGAGGTRAGRPPPPASAAPARELRAAPDPAGTHRAFPPARPWAATPSAARTAGSPPGPACRARRPRHPQRPHRLRVQPRVHPRRLEIRGFDSGRSSHGAISVTPTTSGPVPDSPHDCAASSARFPPAESPSTCTRPTSRSRSARAARRGSASSAV